METTLPITEADLYVGFSRVSRALLMHWKDRIIKIDGQSTTPSIIEDIDSRLLSRNVIVFIDHHYAFDAIPISLALGRTVSNAIGALIPYAVHLDMGVDREGLPSLRYRLRTLVFQRLIENIQKVNDNIHFAPVTRKFELEEPRLKAIVDSQYPRTNIKYLKLFKRLFTRYSAGMLGILSPMAGIAFPEKPVLHPQVYRSLEMIQPKSAQPMPFYFVGAYPNLRAHYHYFAPLLTKHTVVARGPFTLPTADYEQAYDVVDSHLLRLRQAAKFSPPDYSRILHK